jgi:twitching motility protein PilT
MTENRENENKVDWVSHMHGIMDIAIKDSASDIHFKANEPPALRLDSDIKRLTEYDPLSGEQIDALISSVMPANHRETFEKEFEVDFSYQYNDTRFRVNVGLENEGMFATLRIIPKEIRPITQIGFPNECWKKIINLESGLIVVAGKTGSGKTTTLASLINEINKTLPRKIITLEDPIEYCYQGIKSIIIQREIYTHTKSFSRGVKWALRQDPDVILVGEIRDSDTASEVITAVDTGHLVFCTVHSKDGRGAIEKIIDSFPPEKKDEARASIASNVEYILTQQLIPYSRGSDRKLAMEVLHANYGVRSLIRDNKLYQLINQFTSKSDQDMISMDARLAEMCETGLITREDAIRNAIDGKMILDYLS